MHNKIKTGMKGLDKILLGGLIENRSYVILGFAGTGKTILSLQWLIEGIRLGEKCLYITLGELREDIESNIANFGWSLDGIDILDLTIPINSKKNKPIEQYHIFTPDEVEQSYTWDAIYQAIAKEAPKRVVIDSASHLRFLSTDIYQFRKHILMLTNYLNRRGVTSMLLFDPTQMGKDASLSMAVDGILRLRMKNSEGNIIGLRYLEVEKYRGSDFLSGYHPFKIGNTGIKIFYHRAEKIGRGNLTGEFFHSGIKRLDKMLGGGIESGTTTIISGSTGTGKSSLASQFLTHSAMQGTPGLAILFEESTDVFIHRCHTNGIPIDDLIKKIC